MKMGIKKGFTFAELMISLVVIAVITAILYPTISELAPNNNKQLFKSAYKTVELVVAEITASTPDGLLPTVDGPSATNPTLTESGVLRLCKAFEERLNTIERQGECVDDSDDPRFTTTNGMRWYFQVKNADATAGIDENNSAVIVIDVNASNNEMVAKDTQVSCVTNESLCFNSYDKISGFWIRNSKPAGFFVDPKNTVITDTFEIVIKPSGKIVRVSDPGNAHLMDED